MFYFHIPKNRASKFSIYYPIRYHMCMHTLASLAPHFVCAPTTMIKKLYNHLNVTTCLKNKALTSILMFRNYIYHVRKLGPIQNG